MSREDNNLQEVLEAIAERERQPVRCIDCGTTDNLGPLDELIDGNVAVLCDDCRTVRDTSGETQDVWVITQYELPANPLEDDNRGFGS